MEALRLDPGTLIAQDFKVLHPLSEGGMGAVYVVLQLSTERQRALKVMHPQLLADESLKRRFRQEAQISGKIESRHVVQVISAGVERTELWGQQVDIPWLCMELLKGRDLAKLIQQRGPLPLAEVKQILSQLCDALGAAHKVGVIHRDLKPGNIFLAEEGASKTPCVKILDFGISKLVSVSNTTHPQLIGTPEWMAPEQSVSGSSIVPATDVWALGLIAFFLLVGQSYWRTVHQGKSSMRELLLENIEGAVTPASERAKEFSWTGQLPLGFDAWFARCLQRDTQRRFANGSEALEAISEWEIPRFDAAETAVADGQSNAVLRPGNLFAGELRVLRAQWSDVLGPVYKVERLQDHSMGSLRLLHPRLMEHGTERTLALMSPDLPGVVPVFGSGSYQGQPWLLLALQVGTLAELVSRQGGLPPVEAQQIYEQVSRAVEAAHGAGLVHQALSPHSVTIEPGRSPKLLVTAQVMDFGVARRVAAIARVVSSDDAVTICDQEYLALWAWIAPEALDNAGRSGHPTEDIWSLGLLAYYLLSGQHYFCDAMSSGSLMALINEITRGVVVSASVRAGTQGHAAALPAGFDDWFARCLALQPMARFASARDARQAWTALWSPSAKPHARELQPNPHLIAELRRAETVPLAPSPLVPPAPIEKAVALTWKIALAALLVCVCLMLLIGLQTC